MPMALPEVGEMVLRWLVVGHGKGEQLGAHGHAGDGPVEAPGFV